MLRRLRAGAGQTKQKSRRALVLYRELLNNQTSNHCKSGYMVFYKYIPCRYRICICFKYMLSI
jgi:hypothetical protein